MAAQDQQLRRRSPRPTPAPCRHRTPLTIRAPSGENAAAARPRPHGRAGPAAPRRSPRPTPAPCCPRTRSRSARRRARTPPHSTRPSWPRRTRSSAPLAASHTRTVLSSDPLTIRAPSGENAAAVTAPLMAAQDQQLRAARRVPHPHRVVPGPADDPRAVRRERRPSTTAPSWPRRTSSSAPLAASHTRTVLSPDPLTMRAPSGENAGRHDRSPHGRAGPAAPPRSPRPTPAPCRHQTR